MKNRITPTITELEANEIFVFGSNKNGCHDGGAAKLAHQKFGAIYGNGHGPQGKSYAIDTMSGIAIMKTEIETFIKYASHFPEKNFLVTELGCGIAGYSPIDIAPMFFEAIQIQNIHLPKRFWEVLNG